MGGNHGDKAGCLSVESVAIVSGKCPLLPGDNIIPNNLTMPLQALARQLDDLSSEEGGHGHVRIRLWEREREQGLEL